MVASVGPWIGLAYHVAAMKPIALTLFLALATADPMAACRSGSLDLTTRDPSLELGAYGTLFREASQPECQQVAHDQLLRKLRLSLAAPPAVDPVLKRAVGAFQGWLAGAYIGLAFPTA